MSNFNFDENTINKVKNMMDNGELSDVMSKISPEMLQNFSAMIGNANTSSSNNLSDSSNYNNSNKSYQSGNSANTDAANNSTQFNNFANASKQSGFDFSNIDMNTIMKMKSVIEQMNNKNDPRSNLLRSLKPYLREEKKEKLDQYANLMNMAKIADVLKNDNKGNNK